MLLGFFFVFILVVQGEDFTPVVKTFVRIGFVNNDYLNHTFNIDNVENDPGNYMTSSVSPHRFDLLKLLRDLVKRFENIFSVNDGGRT